MKYWFLCDHLQFTARSVCAVVPNRLSNTVFLHWPHLPFPLCLSTCCSWARLGLGLPESNCWELVLGKISGTNNLAEQLSMRIHCVSNPVQFLGQKSFLFVFPLRKKQYDTVNKKARTAPNIILCSLALWGRNQVLIAIFSPVLCFLLSPFSR